MIGILNFSDLANRLFCTFSTKEGIDDTLHHIGTHYAVLFNKIFVLESKDCNEYLCTYNIDTNNSTPRVLENTILLHRKKESNTLYTINALNILIKQLNNGVLDTTYKIEWSEYKNTVLLTQENGLRMLSTRVYRIVNL